MRYLDPDGKYIIVKSKVDGRYGLGSYNHGLNNVHYVTKALSNFIPFGSYSMNLETQLSKIDPTSKVSVLYSSDDEKAIVNTSNAADAFSFNSAVGNNEIYDKTSKIYACYNALNVIPDILKDKIIDKFMDAQETDLFSGCISDNDAMTLGNYLAAGAIYYDANKKHMQEKEISESDWGQKIKQSTNGFSKDQNFESFEKLETTF